MTHPVQTNIKETHMREHVLGGVTRDLEERWLRIPRGSCPVPPTSLNIYKYSAFSFVRCFGIEHLNNKQTATSLFIFYFFPLLYKRASIWPHAYLPPWPSAPDRHHGSRGYRQSS